MKTDQELIAAYKEGNEEALEELIRRHFQSVYTFIFRYIGTSDEVEDVIQDAFIRVWKNIARYNPEKSFRVWLFTIAKNAALDWLKKKKALPFSAFDADEDMPAFEEGLAADAPTAEDDLQQQYSENVLAKGMSTITPTYRNVLVLRSTGLTFKEIAEVVDKPLDTVKSQYRRALQALKKNLDGSILEE